MGNTPPSIYKTLLNGFSQNSGGVWTEVGGPDPPIPLVARTEIQYLEHLLVCEKIY